MQKYEVVLMAYDGTEKGRVALRRSLQFLDPACVDEIHLLAVVPLTNAVAASEGLYTETMYEAERDRFEEILKEGVSILKKQDADAQGHLRAGDPGHQIARLAADLEADLVVVGHQKRSMLARWWQGSVGASLIDRLDCSLLIVQGSLEDSESPEASQEQDNEEQ